MTKCGCPGWIYTYTVKHIQGVVGGLVVKALDCGVRGLRFKSSQLLPREGFSISPPGRKGLQATFCFPVQSCPWGGGGGGG